MALWIFSRNTELLAKQGVKKKDGLNQAIIEREEEKIVNGVCKGSIMIGHGLHIE